FGGSSPTGGGLGTKAYAWDQALDPAYNPTLAVDGNAPSFTDPQNGATQTDVASGNVYVAFNINYTPPSGSGFVYSDTVMRVSTDGGAEFGSFVSITNGVNATSGPTIAVAQGTNSRAANPLAGGSVNVAFSQFDPVTPTNPSSILDQRFPNA